MDHRVSIEPMVSSVFRNILGIWSISEVDSADVLRNLTFNYVDHFVRLLFSDWCEVALQNWVFLWINFDLVIDIFLNLLYKMLVEWVMDGGKNFLPVECI